MILEAIDNLIIETERNYATQGVGNKRIVKDSLGYGPDITALPYFVYKRYTDDPTNPRIKSSVGRLAARFGGQAVGGGLGTGLGYVTGTVGSMATGIPLLGPLGASIGGLTGSMAGHAIGSMGKSGYYCPKGFKQDPNNPDHCIKI